MTLHFQMSFMQNCRKKHKRTVFQYNIFSEKKKKKKIAQF